MERRIRLGGFVRRGSRGIHRRRVSDEIRRSADRVSKRSSEDGEEETGKSEPSGSDEVSSALYRIERSVTVERGSQRDYRRTDAGDEGTAD